MSEIHLALSASLLATGYIIFQAIWAGAYALTLHSYDKHSVPHLPSHLSFKGEGCYRRSRAVWSGTKLLPLSAWFFSRGGFSSPVYPYFRIQSSTLNNPGWIARS